MINITNHLKNDAHLRRDRHLYITTPAMSTQNTTQAQNVVTAQNVVNTFLNKRNYFREMSDAEFDENVGMYAAALVDVGFSSLISDYNSNLKCDELKNNLEDY